MTSLFFKDSLINIPKKYSHSIEGIDKDSFYKEQKKVILSCYFTGKKDPIHHESLKDEKRREDDYNYMRPLYESCKKLKLHLIIFHDNLSKKFVDRFKTDKIIFRKVSLSNSKLSINDERFIIYYEYLSKNPYEVVFSSDIGDVYLKSSPFKLRKTFFKRPNIDQSIVKEILGSKNMRDSLKNSPYQPQFESGNKMTDAELKRYVIGLKELDPSKFSIPHLLFIGTNSIDNGYKQKTKEWFERRKDKVKSFNDALFLYIPKYKEYKSGDFQMYNPGTLMGNYNTYMCFMKKFLKILFVCTEVRENNNWNMVIANYVCHNFLKDDYNKDTFHSKYIYTGYPFNTIYQRKEKLETSDCCLQHK